MKHSHFNGEMLHEEILESHETTTPNVDSLPTHDNASPLDEDDDILSDLDMTVSPISKTIVEKRCSLPTTSTPQREEEAPKKKRRLKDHQDSLIVKVHSKHDLLSLSAFSGKKEETEIEEAEIIYYRAK